MCCWCWKRNAGISPSDSLLDSDASDLFTRHRVAELIHHNSWWIDIHQVDSMQFRGLSVENPWKLHSFRRCCDRQTVEDARVAFCFIHIAPINECYVGSCEGYLRAFDWHPWCREYLLAAEKIEYAYCHSIRYSWDNVIPWRQGGWTPSLMIGGGCCFVDQHTCQ